MSETNEVKEKKTLSAKILSKVAIIFSGLWIAGLTLLKGFGIVELDIDDIIYSGLTITAVWCPTFISIYFDKIKAIKELK